MHCLSQLHYSTNCPFPTEILVLWSPWYQQYSAEIHTLIVSKVQQKMLSLVLTIWRASCPAPNYCSIDASTTVFLLPSLPFLRCYRISHLRVIRSQNALLRWLSNDKQIFWCSRRCISCHGDTMHLTQFQCYCCPSWRWSTVYVQRLCRFFVLT